MGRLQDKVALISGGSKNQGAAEARVFAAEGDVISREGTQSTGLYFIVSGQVALSQGWECKQVLGPGGALDENAVVDGDGSGIVWYTATALEPTEMVVILRSDFEDLVAHRPDFIPTYNLDSWDSVKARILQRRSHRLGIDSCQQVCACVCSGGRCRVVSELSGHDFLPGQVS